MKNEPKISIPKETIREIFKEYDFKEKDKYMEYDDKTYDIIKKFEALEPAEKIILELYAEFQSQRKVGNILGVSRTTVIKLLNNIRDKIIK